MFANICSVFMNILLIVCMEPTGKRFLLAVDVSGSMECAWFQCFLCM